MVLSWPLGWRQILAIAALAAAALTLIGGLPIWLSLILVGSPTAAVLGRSRSGERGGESGQGGSGDPDDGASDGGDGGGGDGGSE